MPGPGHPAREATVDIEAALDILTDIIAMNDSGEVPVTLAQRAYLAGVEDGLRAAMELQPLVI